MDVKADWLVVIYRSQTLRSMGLNSVCKVGTRDTLGVGMEAQAAKWTLEGRGHFSRCGAKEGQLLAAAQQLDAENRY